VAAVVCGLLTLYAARVATAQTAVPPQPAQTLPVPVSPAQTLPPPPSAVPSVAGFWEQSDDKGEVGAWFLFSQKDGLYDGRLVKMFPKPGQPVFETCTRCTGDQKNARMLGLAIISGMKRDGFDYKEGSILDPRDGSVYHAEMAMSPDGKTLAVRGYLFTPMFGQTQIWKRLPDDALSPASIPKDLLAPSAKP